MIKLPNPATAIALAGALAVVAATPASAAPVNGLAVTAAVPSLTTEVKHRSAARRLSDDGATYYWGYPNYSNWGYPGYSNWGYPGYSYWGYPTNRTYSRWYPYSNVYWW